MSWNAYLKHLKWYSLFQGLWSEDSTGDIPQDQMLHQSMVGRGMRTVEGASYLAQANNIYAPGISRILRKRPGFSAVRSSAINASGVVTGMVHLGEIADEFILAVSIAGTSHGLYRDNANPPGAITGGTAFTIGADNLVDSLLFTDGTNPMAIFLSRLRDLPQSVNASATRANFTIAGTGLTSLKPGFGEIFAQRALYGDVDFDGTVYDDRVYWSDIRDGNLISDPTTQFLSFETRLKDKVRAIRKLSDICLIGKLNNIFTMVPTPEATVPFMVQEEPGGKNKGPISQQAVLEIDQQLFWIGQSNLHSLGADFTIRDWADAIQPTIRGLNDSRRDFAVAGVDPDRSLILFTVSDAGQTTNSLTIGLNVKTGALYLWTTRRNAYAHREVSGQIRLIGGGYTGFFYNELTGTAGDLDDATAVIDADVITPRYWVGSYGVSKKIPFVLLKMDPIASETLTVQWRADDSTTWLDPEGSPYSISGTDDDTVLVPIGTMAERIQLRLRNNTADAVYNCKAIGIPGLPLQLSIN